VRFLTNTFFEGKVLKKMTERTLNAIAI